MMPSDLDPSAPFFAVCVAAPCDFFRGMQLKQGEGLHIAGRERWARAADPMRFSTHEAAWRFILERCARWDREGVFPYVSRVSDYGSRFVVWTALDRGGEPIDVMADHSDIEPILRLIVDHIGPEPSDLIPFMERLRSAWGGAPPSR